jgi:hypothetical protein
VPLGVGAVAEVSYGLSDLDETADMRAFQTYYPRLYEQLRLATNRE